jgi:hypothetical protein
VLARPEDELENVLAATSIVVAPLVLGVKVAEYTAPLPAKLLSEPPVEVISPTAKSVVDSLDVNVNPIELFEVVDPSVTPEVELVIVIVGGTGMASSSSIFLILIFPYPWPLPDDNFLNLK